MFKLTNARGETVDINTPSLRSYTPTGLGLQITNSYSPYETYFIPTKSVLSQGIMQVYMKFGDIESQSYQSFSDFARFLAYQPYTLEYDFDDNTYYRDARLQSLTKTEIGGSTIDAYDRLNEIFTLEFINNWYNNKTAEYKSYDPDPNLGTYGKIYGNQIADTSIQINSQGQQNKLVNTEFSPDFSGWYSGQSTQTVGNAFVTGTPISSSTGWSLDTQKYKGSNVIKKTVGTGSGTFSDLIPVQSGSQISVAISYYNSSDYSGSVPLAFNLRYYDINKKYISTDGQNNAASTSFKNAVFTKTVPTGAVYVSFNTIYNGSSGSIYYSQPMLVFDSTVGDYVQGLEYNHMATPAYTYAYAPYYVYQESNRPSNEKVMSLNNKSQYFGLQSGSPSVITVNGPCSVNPTWTVVQNGNVVATDGFVLTLTDNQKLVVSSYPEDQYARIYNPDGSYVDVSQLQDYTKTNFVQIPEGESTVLFYLDADSDVNITFKEERLLV
jgi:hypothetical protein